MAVGWDPQTYLGYAQERARPFHDLLARVGAEDPRRVVDLGCGPGGLTAELARRWPAAHVVGVDSSAEMVERARSKAEPGHLDVVLGDVRDWRPNEPVDVIVTNATLQWVPGHLDLLRMWVRQALRPGGWLALQVPGNFHDPQHTLLAELARSPRWSGRLSGPDLLRGDVPGPAEYAEVLAAEGCVVDAWETTYLHVLDPEGRHGPDAVLQWAMGTSLRPVLDVLPEGPEREEFLTAYAERLRAAFPRRPWGTLLPFRRVFAVAHREEGR